MNSNFILRIKNLTKESLPLSGINTTDRLQRLFEVGRESLSIAKIMEAHWDAIAILSEANYPIIPKKLYGVWASELPGQSLQLTYQHDNIWFLSGKKMFCSGASLVQRVLVTAAIDKPILVALDIEKNSNRIQVDTSTWHSNAFKDTHTACVEFCNCIVYSEQIIKHSGWYTQRIGFWQGALGPAACWAGGAAALADYTLTSKRTDPHTLAHFAAIQSNIWAMQACLNQSGCEIDKAPDDVCLSLKLALKTRHIIEQLCTDTLRRFTRAYGPYPIACVEDVIQKYHELDLFVRQCHAERDLELLGRSLLKV